MENNIIPFNIEAEKSVLGSIIIDPESIIQIADVLAPADFHRDAHRTIYTYVMDLYERHEPADYITLCDELESAGKLEQVGGASYITSLINAVPTSGNVEHYARIVAQKAVYRRLIHAAGRIAHVAYHEERDALEQAERALYAVSMSHGGATDFATASQIVSDCLVDLEALQNRSKQLVGVATGFGRIDHYTGGLQRSDLIILAARPSVGKSSMALSIAYNAVMGHDAKVAIFSLEMSKKQLMQRLISFDSGIDLYRLRNGYIQDLEWEPLTQACEHLDIENLVIDDTAGITLSALRNKARRLKARQGLDLIVVDYLQLMHADSSGNHNRNREQEVAEISKGLKELAKELDIPVLALAQLSRAVENRQDKRPQLSDLRESGSIENDADIVAFIYREEVHTGVPGPVQFIIGKHRNGPIGSVDLIFQGSTTRFVEAEKQ